MPASITLSNLSWSTPEGRTLFSDLDLSFGAERTGLVGRNGVGKTTLLKLIAGELAPQSGTVAVGGTLGVLRQAVQAADGDTTAELFGVAGKLAILERAEAGEATAEELSYADWMLEPRLTAALARAGLDAHPETRLAALSGGQRTRAALAALIFSEPDFLVLDEPTNNLDREGRRAVADLLANWRGGAIVVSHDRELLETMDAIVELTGLGAIRYGGNYSHYRARKELELAAAEHDRAVAEARIAELARSAQSAAERKARKDGAGKRKAAKGGIPRIAVGGMKERSENTGGEAARIAERRRADAYAEATAARARIEVLQPLTVTLPPTGLHATKTILTLEHLTVGYEPGRPVLSDLSFEITGPKRVAVTGPNGAGKTTLLALIAGDLEPWQGRVAVTPDFAMLDQRVSLLDPALTIRDNFLLRHPQASENACRAALARFMFRADAALQRAGSLSGGELLRAGLACVLGASPPSLLILDEPTNHLDLDSIAAVEAGLTAYDGALLVVSHDEVFLDRIAIARRLELAPPD